MGVETHADINVGISDTHSTLSQKKIFGYGTIVQLRTKARMPMSIGILSRKQIATTHHIDVAHIDDAPLAGVAAALLPSGLLGHAGCATYWL